MRKDNLTEQYRRGVVMDMDVNSDKDKQKPPQSYDISEMSKDTGDTNPKNVRRDG